MTVIVPTASSTTAQAYQAQYAAATNAATQSAGNADTAFSASSGANPLFNTVSSGSTLNSSLLGALLGMNNQGNSPSATPNSATTTPDDGGGTAASAHHHHGISAYIAQLASNVAGSASM